MSVTPQQLQQKFNALLHELGKPRTNNSKTPGFFLDIDYRNDRAQVYEVRENRTAVPAFGQAHDRTLSEMDQFLDTATRFAHLGRAAERDTQSRITDSDAIYKLDHSSSSKSDWDLGA